MSLGNVGVGRCTLCEVMRMQVLGGPSIAWKSRSTTLRTGGLPESSVSNSQMSLGNVGVGYFGLWKCRSTPLPSVVSSLSVHGTTVKIVNLSVQLGTSWA